MAEPKFLKIENNGQVARIILDRPKHNVLDIPMMNELNADLAGDLAASWQETAYQASLGMKPASERRPDPARSTDDDGSFLGFQRRRRRKGMFSGCHSVLLEKFVTNNSNMIEENAI
mgnify:CR=1 FL=1